MILRISTVWNQLFYTAAVGNFFTLWKLHGQLQKIFVLNKLFLVLESYYVRKVNLNKLLTELKQLQAYHFHFDLHERDKRFIKLGNNISALKIIPSSFQPRPQLNWCVWYLFTRCVTQQLPNTERLILRKSKLCILQNWLRRRPSVELFMRRTKLSELSLWLS